MYSLFASKRCPELLFRITHPSNKPDFVSGNSTLELGLLIKFPISDSDASH